MPNFSSFTFSQKHSVVLLKAKLFKKNIALLGHHIRKKKNKW